MRRLMAVLVLGMVACDGATNPDLPTAPAITVASAAEVRLQIGQSIRLTNPDVQIRFLAVPEDSRCPSNVVCVWAGDARIALVASGSVERAFDLHFPSEQLGTRKTTLGAYQVEALALDPAPVAGQPLRPEDYRVTLKVRRL